MSQTGKLIFINPPVTIELAAGEEINNFPAYGNFIRCTENNGDSFEFAFEDAPWIAITAGMAVPLAPGSRPYEYLRFKNPTAVPITIEIRYGIGDFHDDRLKYTGSVIVENAAGTMLTVKQGGSSFDTSQVAISSATTGELLAAQNLDRTALTVRNPEPIGGTVIYLTGDNTGDDSDSFPLYPQEATQISNTAAIYCYHTKGSDINVPIAEEE